MCVCVLCVVKSTCPCLRACVCNYLDVCMYMLKWNKKNGGRGPKSQERRGRGGGEEEETGKNEKKVENTSGMSLFYAFRKEERVKEYRYFCLFCSSSHFCF